MSSKARGILVYLASLPSDCIVYKSEIMKHSFDKKDSFNSWWNELKQAGYIKGVQNRINGKFTGYTWYVSDDRKLMLPEFGLSSDKPNSDKTTTTYTDLTNTNYINNIDTKIDTKGCS